MVRQTVSGHKLFWRLLPWKGFDWGKVLGRAHLFHYKPLPLPLARACRLHPFFLWDGSFKKSTSSYQLKGIFSLGHIKRNTSISYGAMTWVWGQDLALFWFLLRLLLTKDGVKNDISPVWWFSVQTNNKLTLFYQFMEDRWLSSRAGNID